jgi:hypothetical protein
VGFILTVIGTLLLLASLAGVALGTYMALDPKTRESGKLFAVWWVPAVAAASGVLMRDVVTFAVGTLCFLVAGAVFTFEDGSARKPTVRRTREKNEYPETTTRENETGDNKAVS